MASPVLAGEVGFIEDFALARDRAISLRHYGQVQVTAPGTRKPLSKVYVKVYERQAGG